MGKRVSECEREWALAGSECIQPIRKSSCGSFALPAFIRISGQIFALTTLPLRIIINRNSRVPSFLAYKLFYFPLAAKSIISCNIFLYDLGYFCLLLYYIFIFLFLFAVAASFYAVALQLYALFIFPVFVPPPLSIVEIRLTYKHLMDWQSDLITFAIETT